MQSGSAVADGGVSGETQLLMSPATLQKGRFEVTSGFATKEVTVAGLAANLLRTSSETSTDELARALRINGMGALPHAEEMLPVIAAKAGKYLVGSTVLLLVGSEDGADAVKAVDALEYAQKGARLAPWFEGEDVVPEGAQVIVVKKKKSVVN